MQKYLYLQIVTPLFPVVRGDRNEEDQTSSKTSWRTAPLVPSDTQIGAEGTSSNTPVWDTSDTYPTHRRLCHQSDRPASRGPGEPLGGQRPAHA